MTKQSRIDLADCCLLTFVIKYQRRAHTHTQMHISTRRQPDRMSQKSDRSHIYIDRRCDNMIQRCNPLAHCRIVVYPIHLHCNMILIHFYVLVVHAQRCDTTTKLAAAATAACRMKTTRARETLTFVSTSHDKSRSGAISPFSCIN